VSAKSKFPALWDLKMKRRLESLFDRGGTLIEAAREMGVSRSTLNKWFNSTDKQKESFRETVRIGKEASEAWWIRQGRENLETRGFNHGLWLMNMVNRFGWTSSHSKKEEKREIEHTVEVKKKVDVDAILDKAIKKGVEEIEKTIH
jgi:transcriptional regulator with XRE-family HTH domain